MVMFNICVYVVWALTETLAVYRPRNVEYKGVFECR